MQLISKDGLLQAIARTLDNAKHGMSKDAAHVANDIVELVKNAPTAQQWIKLSEQPPSPNIAVLACYFDVHRCEYRTMIAVPHLQPDGSVSFLERNITHWMAFQPLPSPYGSRNTPQQNQDEQYQQ